MSSKGGLEYLSPCPFSSSLLNDSRLVLLFPLFLLLLFSYCSISSLITVLSLLLLRKRFHNAHLSSCKLSPFSFFSPFLTLSTTHLISLNRVLILLNSIYLLPLLLYFLLNNSFFCHFFSCLIPVVPFSPLPNIALHSLSV